MERVPDEYERGLKDGETDIGAGSPKLFWQTRARWGEFLTHLMAERFGIIVEHTSDITWAAQESYRDGYNDAVKAYVERRFGSGSFQAALAEVDQFRQERYRQQFGSS